MDELHKDQAADLRDVVRNGIATTVDKLHLVPGESPSSTVSIVRVGPEMVDVFVLGDTPVILGFTDGTQQRITDDRIHQIPTPARDTYRARLAAGHGYDDEHRRLLAELQHQQRAYRNQEGGYWIAEAMPAAANRAVTAGHESAAIMWIVLLTDGAEPTLVHLGMAHWPAISMMSRGGLSGLREECRIWELATDPFGILWPRAKVHDDKSVAAARLQ